MKIGIISGSSTDSGKSSIAKMLKSWFQQRGESCTYWVIETSEKPFDGEDLKFTPEQADALIGELSLADGNVIVEIGGGEVFKAFMAAADRAGGVDNELDRLVVVVKPGTKTDLIEADIDNFVGRGNDPMTVKAVLNKVTAEYARKLYVEFDALFKLADRIGFTVIRDAIDQYDEVVKKTSKTAANAFTMAALADDTSDIKLRADAEMDPEKRKEIVAEVGQRRKAVKLAQQASKIFEQVVA